MLKRILYILGLCACTYVHAQSFCHLVQDIGTHYEDTVNAAGTYYYSAYIDSLPMDLYFISADPACATPPELWFDLTCTPGVYDDPNIRELIQDTAKYGISVPMMLGCETTWVDSLNTYVHHLKLGKSYRNRLRLVGIDYNVPAYVKVVTACGGIAQIEQDTSSMACYKEARRVLLPDSTRVLANDSLNTYIFPYKDWMAQADSVALYWEGTDSVILWIESSDCEFIPDALHAWDYYDIPANGEYHLSRDAMRIALNSGTQDTTGFFFAKIFSASEGRLFTRPLIPETKGATLLHYDTTQVVHVGDNTSFFCFPKDWRGIEWVADTRRVVKMYLHSSPESAPVDSFYFDLPDTTIRRVLLWSKPEMNLLRTHADGQLLFVRFECSGDFKFTPYNLIESSSCLQSAIRIRSGHPLECKNDKLFALKYDEWKDYPMEILWETTVPNNLQNLFFLDTCKVTIKPTWNQTSYSTRIRTVYYKQTQRGGETWIVDSATIAGWESRVTPEGFFYIEMTGTGTLTITNNRPSEQDPDDGLPLDPEEEEPGGTTTGWFIVEPETQCTKLLYHGQIVIFREGKYYTITGQVIMQ